MEFMKSYCSIHYKQQIGDFVDITLGILCTYYTGMHENREDHEALKQYESLQIVELKLRYRTVIEQSEILIKQSLLHIRS